MGLTAADTPLDRQDSALVAALRDGLPLDPRPYAALGARLGLDEAEVIDRLRALTDNGTIRRFGAIVHHHALGYRANAMCVFDVPDDQLAAVVPAILAHPFVTLCYRRLRRPSWPYNLFCMIHGRAEAEVRALFAGMVGTAELDFPHAMLFSRRRFKQSAGHYGKAG